MPLGRHLLTILHPLKHASVLTLVIVDDFLIKKYSKTTSIDHIFTYFSIKTISNKIIYREREIKNN